MTSEGVSLGKGAWDCDKNIEIPPEKEVCTSEALVVWCSISQGKTTATDPELWAAIVAQ